MIEASPDLQPVLGRLRAVHRAMGELRRGTPVLLDGYDGRAVLLAAETTGADGLRAFAALASAPPVLLLTGMRAAALTGRPMPDGPVAFDTGALLTPPTLRGVADPTADQLLADPLTPAPLPAAAAAAMALVKLARVLPAALFASVADGTAPGDTLRVSAADVLSHADISAASLVRVAEAAVPLADAPDARVIAFRSPDAGIEHLAIVIGDPAASPAPLVRVHSECFTGDLLGSLRCDCGPQLRLALERIGAAGAGVVLYLSQEGRGIGLANKLRAYALQDRGLDTLDANRALGWYADERNFLIAATMLRDLGLPRIRMLTNNPSKVAALQACGIEVMGIEPLRLPPNGVNDAYLATKARRFGHLME